MISDNPFQVPRVYSVSYTYFLQHLPRSLLYPCRNTHFLKQRSPRFHKEEIQQGQARPGPVETANTSFILWTLLHKAQNIPGPLQSTHGMSSAASDSNLRRGKWILDMRVSAHAVFTVLTWRELSQYMWLCCAVRNPACNVPNGLWCQCFIEQDQVRWRLQTRPMYGRSLLCSHLTSPS